MSDAAAQTSLLPVRSSRVLSRVRSKVPASGRMTMTVRREILGAGSASTGRWA